MLEKHIENDICFYLEWGGVSIDKIISEWYFNESKWIYQKRNSPYAKPGHSDLSWVIPPLWRALYIEVKQPDEMSFFDKPVAELLDRYTEALYNAKGKTPKAKKQYVKKRLHAYEQWKFIEEKLKAWAVAFFASSVEEVIKKLKDFWVSIS